MADKQGLLNYLSRSGKTDKESWMDLALMFGFDSPEKARKTWSKYRLRTSLPSNVKKYPILNPPINQTTGILTKRNSIKSDLDVIREEIRAIVREPNELAKQFLDFKESIKSTNCDREYLLELAVFDLHIGKLADQMETGEEYNTDIACQRFKDSIKELLGLVDTSKIERILLPIGNDLIHTDNKRGTTTAGTQVDCDSRFTKMTKVTKDLLINTINELSLLAPVDVIIVTGNHDSHATYMIGEILSAFYHNSPLVKVDNSPTQRKYYTYGSVAIQLTHGNEEKHHDLGLIFATERPHIWGLSKYRYCQLGHYHKNKRTNYVSIDEYQGFQVQILPSLSGTDAWHSSKGYFSKKAAKAFLFSKQKGLVAEYTYNV